MDSSSEEEISDSEIETHSEELYNLLKNNEFSVEYEKKSGTPKIQKRTSDTLNQVLKMSDGKFKCPLCPGKKKTTYGYTELVQHSSGKRKGSAKMRAGHLAIAKYLKIDLSESPQDSDPAGLALPDAAELQVSPNPKRDEMFVVPWTGILVNLPIEPESGEPKAVSNSNLRSYLIRKGFNPNKVEVLYNVEGYQRKALVSFNNGMAGFLNAVLFEKAFETVDHGKVDWSQGMHQSSKVFGWVARTDDFRKDDVVGKRLRAAYGLKTIAQVEAEEVNQERKCEQQHLPGNEPGKLGLQQENEGNEQKQPASKRSKK